MKAIKTLIIVVVAFYLIGKCTSDKTETSSNNSTTTESQIQEDEYSKQIEAFGYAENYVKKLLKSPSTAEFPSWSIEKEQITKIGEDKWRITSYVDSQNGFGAMIRTTYTLTVRFDGDMVRIRDFKII